MTLKLSTLIILMPLFSISAQGNQSCSNGNQVNFNKGSLESCLKMKSNSKKSDCLSRQFGNDYSFKIQENSMITLLTRRSFCINSLFIEASPSQTIVHFTPTGDIRGVSNFKGSIEVGRIQFVHDLCGWNDQNKIQPVLSPNFDFIPKLAKVRISSPGCQGDFLQPGSVSLVAATPICGTSLVAKTAFGYGADDHYHFTALNDGTMKGTDRGGKPIDIPIKKGKDYRNSDPAEHPCKWEETPDEVLKSFTEEHSE